MGRKVVLRWLLLGLLVAPVAAKAQSDDHALQVRRAESLERAGQLDRALAILDRILAETPAQERALLAVERINRRLRQNERTLDVVARAQAAEPRASAPRRIELRVLAELGRFDQLLRAGRAWIDVDPSSPLAYAELSGILRTNGALDEAEGILKRGIGAVAAPTGLRSELADLYLQGKRWGDAAEQWAALAQTSPSLAWDIIPFKLRRLGSRAQPVADALAEALEAGSPSWEIRRIVAIAALYAGREDAAKRAARQVIGELSDSDRQDFVSELTRVASRSHPDLVSWSYRLLLPYAQSDSVRLELTREIVRYDLSAGDTVAALGILDDLLAGSGSFNGSHRWAFAWQIRLQARAGHAGRAGNTFRRYLETYPDDAELPSLALTVAEANMRRGRLDEAQRALDAVAGLAEAGGLGSRIASARGYLALHGRRYEEARAELEAAVIGLQAAERAAALRFLGFLRDANRGELDALAAAHAAALGGRPLVAHDEITRRIGDVPPSPARPGLLLWAGELAVEAGSLDRAEATLRQVGAEYAETPEAPIALMALAEALSVEPSRRTEAIEILESIILDYPDSAVTPIARRKLAELRRQIPHS